MTRRRWLGFDVGGANIKLANTSGYAKSVAFPLWKHPEQLADQLGELLLAAPPSDSIVATMTGELADCYATKREGVHSIVESLCQIMAGRDLFIYLTDGKIVPPETAKVEYRAAAASNWHALANFASRLVEDDKAILVDVGSTTCDVVPISGGSIVAKGLTDTERLCHSELVYLGIDRTPICSLVSQLPYRGSWCPVARELFATSLDAHIVMGELPESPEQTDTADGQPATIHKSMQRLARCICADHDEFDHDDARALADYIVNVSAALLRAAIESVAEQHGFNEETPIILSGHGDFLFDRAKPNCTKTIPLAGKIGENAARCAPAYAVAVLAEAANPG